MGWLEKDGVGGLKLPDLLYDGCDVKVFVQEFQGFLKLLVLQLKPSSFLRAGERLKVVQERVVEGNSSAQKILLLLRLLVILLIFALLCSVVVEILDQYTPIVEQI